MVLLRTQSASDSRQVPEWRGLRFTRGGSRKIREILLRRYGVVFRRLLERENFSVTWYEVGSYLSAMGSARRDSRRLFRRRSSGEQFALPEAIGLLRSIRKDFNQGRMITLSAADPLNLQGISTPGPRIAALTANRILFRDGLPMAAMEAGKTQKLADDSVSDRQIETALKVGKLRSLGWSYRVTALSFRAKPRNRAA